MKYLLVAFSLILSGCVQTLWKHEPSDDPKKPKGGWEDSFDYYVVDPNSDIPDADFKTLNEAKNYKQFELPNINREEIKDSESLKVTLK